MKKTILTILGCLGLAVGTCAQTSNQLIQMGKLTTDLNANNQDIVAAKALTIGPTTLASGLLASPAARIHILPEGTPTTAADGIWLGTDVKLFRSDTGELSITGNLVVSGTIQTQGADPVQLGTNNIWTGTNTWNSTATFSGTTVIGTNGLTFTGSGASNTAAALDLEIGTDVQQFSAKLDAIRTGSATADNFLVGNGTLWVTTTPADARLALALDPTADPTFNSLSISTDLSVVGVVEMGPASTIVGAISNATALKIGAGGTAGIYATGGNLVTDQGFTSKGSAIVLGNDAATPTDVTDTVNVQGTITFGSSADVNLYRASATELKTDDALISASLKPVAPLGVAYGGFGVVVSSQTADQIFYTNGTGLSLTSLTSLGRDLIGQSSKSSTRTYLELGTLATQSGTFSGTSSGTNTGDQTITLSGDIAGSGTGAITTTLPTVNAGVGTYGSATMIPVVVANAKGQITGITEIAAAPVIGANSVTLATHTTGNYVGVLQAGVSLPAGSTNITVSTSGLEGGTYQVDTIQDIKPTSSPTFTGLSLTTLGVGGVASFSSGVASTNSTSGSIVVTGGAGISGALNVGGNAAVTGTLAVTGATTLTGALAVNNTITLTRTTAGNLFAAGYAGATNPGFLVYNNAASANSTGLKVISNDSGSGVELAVISPGTPESLTITALGTGTTTIQSSGTGAIALAENTAVTGTFSTSGAATLASATITGAATMSSTASVAGVLTPTGGVAAAGGFSVSPRTCHTGGVPVMATTDGTNTTDNVASTIYLSEIFVPANMSVTGIALFNGTAVAGNCKVMLFDSAGTRVAISASTAVSGAAAYQLIPLTGNPIAVNGPATYYVGVIYDTTTCDLRSHTVGAFGTGIDNTTNTYATDATMTTVTVPTTFTTAQGPIATLY